MPQRRIVEQFTVRLKGRVLIGEPQHQHLFQFDLMMRRAAGFAAQVFLHRNLTAVDRHRRKLLHETAQRFLHFLRPDLRCEVVERFLHDTRILRLAILLQRIVLQFVDQTQRIDLPGLHGLIGRTFFIDPLGKNTRRVEVGKNHIAVERE